MSELTVKLYQHIADANEPRVMEHWHASSIGFCPRTQYYQRLGVKPLRTANAGKMLRWKAGHLMEEAIRPHIETEYGKVMSNERFTSKKWDFTGEYDNYLPDHQRLIEVKSVHDFAIKIDKATGEAHLRDQAPYYWHQLQNHGYALLMKEIGVDVLEIEYLYITLDGLMTSYKTKVDPNLLENVRSRLSTLRKAWETKTPPPCICHLKEHPCYGAMKWCDYYDDDSKECCSLKLIGKEGKE